MATNASRWNPQISDIWNKVQDSMPRFWGQDYFAEQFLKDFVKTEDGTKLVLRPAAMILPTFHKHMARSNLIPVAG